MTDPTEPPVSRVRGHIGAAAASTSDLLDLLTLGLAEHDRHSTPSQPPPATPDPDENRSTAKRDGLTPGWPSTSAPALSSAKRPDPARTLTSRRPESGASTRLTGSVR